MDLNQVTIFGRLGKDPELRSTPGGHTLCSFAIAYTEWKKDDNAKSGWAEETSWFDCTMFGDNAKRFAERAKKGHKVIVLGNLKQRTWEDKDGNKREKVGINVRAVQYLEKKPKAAEQTTSEPVAEDDVPF